jgi:DNA-binding NarL/FixJ family response regulator
MGAVTDDARFVSVALEYGRALGYTGTRNDEAIAALRAGIDRADDAHVDLREQATADLVNACWTEPQYLPAAKELIAQIRDEDLAGGRGSDMIRALLAHHELRRGVDRSRASALAARALASGELEAHSSQELFYALDTLRGTGDLEAGRAAYTSALAAATRRGDLLNAGGLMTFRGWLEIDQGDLHAAEADVREGLAHSEEHGMAGQVLYSAIFVALYLLERGDVDEAERVVEGLRMPEQLPDNFHFLHFWRVRGRLRLARRRPELALTDFLAIRRVTEQLEMPNPDWPWRSDAAAALLALGSGEQARELAAEELALARRWGARRQIGIALRTLAKTSPAAQAADLLREACDVLAPSPARLEHARALVALGAALRRANERGEARELLREGVELAHACGAVALVEHANEELAATGARPRKVVLTGLDSLTASERRVAQLASEDLSNKAIAQTLFVTVKTVELHLSNVYRKLDIASRRQLAPALDEQRASSLAGS